MIANMYLRSVKMKIVTDSKLSLALLVSASPAFATAGRYQQLVSKRSFFPERNLVWE